MTDRIDIEPMAGRASRAELRRERDPLASIGSDPKLVCFREAALDREWRAVAAAWPALSEQEIH